MYSSLYTAAHKYQRFENKNRNLDRERFRKERAGFGGAVIGIGADCFEVAISWPVASGPGGDETLVSSQEWSYISKHH